MYDRDKVADGLSVKWIASSVESGRVPAFPQPLNIVEYRTEGVVFEDDEAQIGMHVIQWHPHQWQNDPEGKVIWEIFSKIHIVNKAEWQTLGMMPPPPPEGLMHLEWYEDDGGNIIEAFANDSPGFGQSVSITVNREEDSHWIQDEWSREEDPDLEAIGAVFGALSEVYRGAYRRTMP